MYGIQVYIESGKTRLSYSYTLAYNAGMPTYRNVQVNIIKYFPKG